MMLFCRLQWFIKILIRVLYFYFDDILKASLKMLLISNYDNFIDSVRFLIDTVEKYYSF